MVYERINQWIKYCMHENHRYVFHRIRNRCLIGEFYNEKFDYDQLRDKSTNNDYQIYRTFYGYDVFHFRLIFVDDNV